jgi:hypothetical protein
MSNERRVKIQKSNILNALIEHTIGQRDIARSRTIYKEINGMQDNVADYSLPRSRKTPDIPGIFLGRAD